MSSVPVAQRCHRCGRILFSTRAGKMPRHWRDPQAVQRTWCQESDRAAFAGVVYERAEAN